MWFVNVMFFSCGFLLFCIWIGTFVVLGIRLSQANAGWKMAIAGSVTWVLMFVFGLCGYMTMLDWLSTQYQEVYERQWHPPIQIEAN